MKIILANQAAVPAIPENPKIAAIKAIIKNVIAHPIIVTRLILFYKSIFHIKYIDHLELDILKIT